MSPSSHSCSPNLPRTACGTKGKLTDLLNRHFFGAVVTFKDPGNIVFKGRFRPATTAAILANYPHVQVFGDNRLRLEK